MNPSNRLLFESDNFRLYSCYESSYLKCKNVPDRKDVHISCCYGDPSSGLISTHEEFVAVSGCGIAIFFIEDGSSYELGTDPEDILWTEGIYQSEMDTQHQVRFTAETKDGLIRVHRLDVKSRELEVL
ncbi:hypothetical protein N480_00425 [Pseudoalteromonas luteoviolacea S2607]|uniref:hypothetical protein n=1 Tax=Pseudoalteromonas luteoviolacea TaxID=43657 RepID=UPI0007B08306|nr:hypothetical protein [Pseudoalteromonas luteoviolacea]KZN39326.1 hypothetical protein N480_00425 [Pseudoalteromonas luteoviolacea S2607]